MQCRAVPVPYPTFSKKFGIASLDLAKYLIIIAPVGVAHSPSCSPTKIIIFDNNSKAAGTGNEISPCAHLTVLKPTRAGEVKSCSSLKYSIPKQAPMISIIASTAPTSRK
jgi:hypothetical protein